MNEIATCSNFESGNFLVRRSHILDGLSFLIGMLSFWHISMVGQLYVVEILAPVLFLLLWPRKHKLLMQKPVVIIVFCGLLWLVGQVITDFYRGTPWSDLARGWAAICVFLLLFATLVQLVSGKPRRMYLLLLGTALGGIIKQFIQPSPYFVAQPWKFGFGPPLALFLLSWVGWHFWDQKRLPLRWLLALLAFGMLSFYLHARSLGGFVIMTSLLVRLRFSPLAKTLVAHRPSFTSLLAGAGMILILAMVVLQSYEFVASRGWLGEKAQQKFEMQSTGKFGLIIGGRVELIPAVFAVRDSPIIGHGSWAKGPEYREYLWLLLDLGYDRSEAQLNHEIAKSDIIPAHSHILQSWVWAGILGAIFWVVVLVLIIRVAIMTFWFPHRLFMPTVFFVLSGVWAIFFSPFGAMIRFHWAMMLCLFFLSLQLSKIKAVKYRRYVVRSI